MKHSNAKQSGKHDQDKKKKGLFRKLKERRAAKRKAYDDLLSDYPDVADLCFEYISTLYGRAEDKEIFDLLNVAKTHLVPIFKDDTLETFDAEKIADYKYQLILNFPADRDRHLAMLLIAELIDYIQVVYHDFLFPVHPMTESEMARRYKNLQMEKKHGITYSFY